MGIAFLIVSCGTSTSTSPSVLPDWCGAIGLDEISEYPQCQVETSSKSPLADRPGDDWKNYLLDPHQHADRRGEASAALFEGDILNFDKTLLNSSTGEETAKVMANAVRDPKLKWNRGIIPYVISPKIPPKDQKIIRQAMDTFHRKTCIRFKPRTQEEDYISIESKEGCNSYIGKVGGSQQVSLQVGQCYKAGKVEHELMHVVGFTHEQSRTDRDEYVFINWDNIPEESAVNFQKYNSDMIDSLGAPYDYGSVMHYGPFFFAVDPNAWTILPRAKGVEIGQRRTMSETDIWKINLMYNCPQSRQKGEEGSTTTKAPNVPECPDGWSVSGSTCLYFSKENAREAMSWTDAKNVCEAQLASLVTIEDAAANQVVTDKFKGIVDDVWISATINGEKYQWITSAGSKEVFYSNWADLEPKNCVLLNKEGTWRSDSCDASYDFICARPLHSMEAAPASGDSGEKPQITKSRPPPSMKRNQAGSSDPNRKIVLAGKRNTPVRTDSSR